MVKFYKSLVLSLFVSPLLLAQTPAQRAEITQDYDFGKLAELRTEFLQIEQEQRAQALQMAAIKGWPETIQGENGFYGSLIGIYENGQPKYRITHNREGAITTRANTLHTGGVTGLNLDGQDMIVGEWDGGSVNANHPLLSGRVDQIDGATGTSDHATHVAGTLVGTGTVANGAAKGMLHEGTLWAHDWFSDYPEMIAAAGNGLLVSNHSYGSNIQNAPLWRLGYYDNDARGLDNIQYNAPFYLACVSAGNDRQSGVNPGDGGFDYLTDMSTAKNALTVAATFEVLNYTAPSSVAMSGFSSWGPTDDGRVKPDISGKGVNMYSSVGAQGYANYSGTSMSSPNVAGSIVLLQQYYNQLNSSFMKGATLRGLVIHSADETGSADGPDYRFGWGLLNVQRGAEIIAGRNDSSYLIEESIASGETLVFSVSASGTQPLMGTVAWTDPPGTPLPANATSLDDPTPMLVNDIDFRLTSAAGVEALPWRLDPGNFTAAATQADNFVDNVEKIEIGGAVGTYTAKISHKGANLVEGVQDVSIIISGMGTPDFFALTHDGQVYLCLGDTAADFTVDFNPLNGYAGGVSFTATGLPSGVSASFSNPTLSDTGATTMTLSGVENLAAGDYTIVIDVVGTGETQSIPVTLTVLSDDPSTVPMSDLLDPVDGAVDIPIVYELQWSNGGPTVISYDVEVSRDIDFTNVQFAQSSDFPSSLILGMQEGYTYWWRVRSNTECAVGEWSSAFTFTVAGILGIESQESLGLSLFPNPASQTFNLRSETPMQRIELRNVLGQVVIVEDIQSTEAQVNVDALSQGTYFVRVYRDGVVANLKLVKE